MPKADRGTTWLKRCRQDVLVAMGGACSLCGSTHKLTFDHIRPESRKWVACNFSPYARMLLYAVDIARGEVQLLCDDCNKAKESNRRKQLELRLQLDPF